MPLRPDEIENREFTSSLRGFDRHEVRAFLRRVAADIRELEEQTESDTFDVDLVDETAQIDVAGFGDAADSVIDRFGAFGDRIAGLLRQAHEAASKTTQEADEYAANRRTEVDDELETARAAAGRMREEASDVLEAAKSEAGRLRQQASDVLEAANSEAVGIRERAETEGAARVAEREAEVGRIETEIRAEREAISAEVGDAKAQVARLLEEARAQSDFIRHEADEAIRARIRTNIDQAQKRIELLRNTETASRNRILTAQRELEAALGRLDDERVPDLGPEAEDEALAEAEQKAIQADYPPFYTGDDDTDEAGAVFEAHIIDADVLDDDPHTAEFLGFGPDSDVATPVPPPPPPPAPRFDDDHSTDPGSVRPDPPTPPTSEDDLARMVREAMQKVVDGARRNDG